MIYIQIHFTTHGIAYCKHLLSHFYHNSPENASSIEAHGLDQLKLNEVFDKKHVGYTFDKVYYLYADQSVFNKISSVGIKSKENIYMRDQLVNRLGLTEEWKMIVDSNKENLEEELKLISTEPNLKRRSKEILNTYWRNIQHYLIEDQIWWFRHHSNASTVYDDTKFRTVNLTKEYNLNDLRNHQLIADCLGKFIYDLTLDSPSKDLLINISLGSYETQLAWFVLSEKGVLPPSTRFISSYDDKSSSEERFKLMDIREVPTKLFTTVSENIELFDKTNSKKRDLANQLFKQYMNMGFSILLLGERGVGKSKLAEQHKQYDNFKSQNCAAFDNDNKAEALLFGYMAGAYTDAKKETEGLFQAANGGVLFLDEVHHLSKQVQGKLMKALQTDDNNFYRIHKLGSTKEERIKCTVIFASNLDLEEVKTRLLPDFYDRISQLIIEIPSLRETVEDREEDWKAIWKQLKFEKDFPGEKVLTDDPKFFKWLKEQKLYGNYRDLQKIAILYRAYIMFPSETKDLVKQTHGYRNAYEYTTKEFRKYYLQTIKSDNPYLDLSSEPNRMINRLRRDIVHWAEASFGSVSEAYQHFRQIDKDTPTAKTLYEWRKSGNS
jgi:hypothetical protein